MQVDWKPSIKVGYDNRKSLETGNIEVKLHAHVPKKNVQSDMSIPERVSQKRHHQPSLECNLGRFEDSFYQKS